MGNVGFLFSGQGDQYPGMGLDLYQREKEAKEVFERLEKIRTGNKKQCFEGSEEELKHTANTQPCLFTVEMAIARVVEKYYKPTAVAGFSLGEVVAATYSGLFNLETGFSLVMERGSLMERDGSSVNASMAAIVKLDDDTVKEIASSFNKIYAVNFNCPGQVTVSGIVDEMPLFYEKVKEAGGRAIPLKVSGVFHSPFMTKASEDFRKLLLKTEIQKPNIDLYSNFTSLKYDAVKDYDEVTLLSKQISKAVLWEKLIKNMILDGITTFIEIGPGKTLTNMVKKIDGSVVALTYREALDGVMQC